MDYGDYIPEGEVATDPQHASVLYNSGSVKCATPGCFHYLSPEGQDYLQERNEGFTCPNCNRSDNLLEGGGWQSHDADMEKPARAGMSLSEFGKMGEAVVHYQVVNSPEWLERYGPVVHWQSGINNLLAGGGQDAGRLDGISKAPDGTVWGIEVKAANSAGKDPSFNLNNYDRDNKHLYAANFSYQEPQLAEQLGVARKDKVNPPERAYRPSQDQTKEAPYGRTISHEFDQGNNDIDALVGVLPVFDFNRSVVDIYVQESPLSGYPGQARGTNNGFIKFRPHTAQHLLEEIPFRNPYLDPHSNNPLIVRPQQIVDPQYQPSQEDFANPVIQPQKEEMPF